MSYLRASVLVAVVCTGGALMAQVPAAPEFNAASYGSAGAPQRMPVETGARGATAWQRIYVDGKMMIVPAVSRSEGKTLEVAEADTGYSVTPLPYLQYRRSITGRVKLAPYAPGYTLAPEEMPKSPSPFKVFMSSCPATSQNDKQVEYLGYYDAMPNVLANPMQWYHRALGVPMPEWGKAYCANPLCCKELPPPLLWHDGACPQCCGFEDNIIHVGEVKRMRRAERSKPFPQTTEVTPLSDVEGVASTKK